MVDINYQNLPPQEGYKIDVRKLEGFTVHPGNPPDEGPTPPRFLGRAFGSNDFHITYIEMEPGEMLPWHTHTPIMQQIYMPLKGRVKVSYVDNDGDEHDVEGGPYELIYLPPGAHNQIECVGDEDLHMQVVERETLITRVEHLINDNTDADDVYDPKNDPKYGLEIDTLRGRVLEMQEGAVESY